MNLNKMARKLAKEMLLARSVVSEKLAMGWGFQTHGSDLVQLDINYYDSEQRDESKEHFERKAKEFAAIAKNKGWKLDSAKLKSIPRSRALNGIMWFSRMGASSEGLRTYLLRRGLR